MHFTGRTWRPPYEAHSVIIQATSGCVYGKCRFCNLYGNERFRMSPLEEFEEDLSEIKRYQPNARRIFWTGADPFAMSYGHLKLRAMGINGLTIGTESGDDETLKLAGKGYTAADIWTQCRKLEEAGIEYYLVYMTGLAGRGGGYRNAVRSARLFSQLRPRFISVTSLTLFPGTEFYDMEQAGRFVPAGEKERLWELQVFIRNLRIRTHIFADSSSNFYPVAAYLPREKEQMVSELQYVLDTVGEEVMEAYRRGLKSLG